MPAIFKGVGESLQWSNFYWAYPFSGLQVGPPPSSRTARRRLLDDATTGTVVAGTTTGAGATEDFYTGVTDDLASGSWTKFSGVCFWTALALAGFSLAHAGLNHLWTQTLFPNAHLPEFLLFPRLELQVVFLGLGGVCNGATAVIAYGGWQGKLAGSLVLLGYPITVLALNALLCAWLARRVGGLFVARGKEAEDVNDRMGLRGLWDALWTLRSGSVWRDHPLNGVPDFVARFSPMFEDFRGVRYFKVGRRDGGDAESPQVALLARLATDPAARRTAKIHPAPPASRVAAWRRAKAESHLDVIAASVAPMAHRPQAAPPSPALRLQQAAAVKDAAAWMKMLHAKPPAMSVSATVRRKPAAPKRGGGGFHLSGERPPMPRLGGTHGPRAKAAIDASGLSDSGGLHDDGAGSSLNLGAGKIDGNAPKAKASAGAASAAAARVIRGAGPVTESTEEAGSDKAAGDKAAKAVRTASKEGGEKKGENKGENKGEGEGEEEDPFPVAALVASPPHRAIVLARHAAIQLEGAGESIWGDIYELFGHPVEALRPFYGFISLFRLCIVGVFASEAAAAKLVDAKICAWIVTGFTTFQFLFLVGLQPFRLALFQIAEAFSLFCELGTFCCALAVLYGVSGSVVSTIMLALSGGSILSSMLSQFLLLRDTLQGPVFDILRQVYDKLGGMGLGTLGTLIKSLAYGAYFCCTSVGDNAYAVNQIARAGYGLTPEDKPKWTARLAARRPVVPPPLQAMAPPQPPLFVNWRGTSQAESPPPVPPKPPPPAKFMADVFAGAAERLGHVGEAAQVQRARLLFKKALVRRSSFHATLVDFDGGGGGDRPASAERATRASPVWEPEEESRVTEAGGRAAGSGAAWDGDEEVEEDAPVPRMVVFRPPKPKEKEEDLKARPKFKAF